MREQYMQKTDEMLARVEQMIADNEQLIKSTDALLKRMRDTTQELSRAEARIVYED